jgi:hypothetical protein
MTDTDKTKPANSKAPSHTAYHVREVNHDESYWTRIGAAWAHKDGNVNPQYIYPGSHMVSTSQGADNLPLGSRLRLRNSPAVNTLISNMPPESQIVARAMQQYGLILADIGSAMYVTGASASPSQFRAVPGQ